MDQILLWIWRDLIVSLFTTGSKHDRTNVSIFLEEIQDVLGVVALERLLNGGRPSEFSRPCSFHSSYISGSDDDDEDGWDEDDCDFEEDEDDDDEDDDDADDDADDDEDEDEDDEDEDDDEDVYADDYASDDTDGRCTCKLHATYWTEQINKERIPLRECVVKRLFAIFKQTPSLRLFRSLTSISLDSGLRDELFETLQEIAGDSPDNLVAALDIYIDDDDLTEIAELLEEYIHLLRPRDLVTLQCAVALLAEETPHQKLALSTFESELGDSFQAIYVAVRSCFVHIEEDHNKAELAEILKLKSSSPARKTRIETWVEQVVSTSNTSMGAMAFAAMMMGLPVMHSSEEEDDSDVLNYVDLDRNDADFDDLRDEFRPDLKCRFETWVQLGNAMTGAKPLLMRLYAKAIELMPYLRSQDIVNEMLAR
jgi:hypothetical protein